MKPTELKFCFLIMVIGVEKISSSELLATSSTSKLKQPQKTHFFEKNSKPCPDLDKNTQDYSILNSHKNQFSCPKTSKQENSCLKSENDRTNSIRQELVEPDQKNRGELAGKLRSALAKASQRIQEKLGIKLKYKKKFKEMDLKDTIDSLVGALRQKQEDDMETNIDQLFKKIENKTKTIIKKTLLPKNCQDVLKKSNTVSGVYEIRPKNTRNAFKVFCDLTTKGGGWTYFLNRFDGSQEFCLDWDDYKKGFGSLTGEFWLGLEHLYELAGAEDNELLVEVVDFYGIKKQALYEKFRLGSELEGYPIKILGKYSGNAGDSLRIHLNQKFNTKDQNTSNCPNKYCGPWWCKSCWTSHLTGFYLKGPIRVEGLQGLSWGGFPGRHGSLREARMMIRPIEP